MKAIVVGPDEDGLGDALEAEGVDVTRLPGAGNRPALEDAGIADADALVLTLAAGATTIPVARDLTDELRIVVYAGDDLPDFARGQADLIVDPRLLSAAAVAEELATDS